MLIEMKSCRWESWGSRDQNDHPPRMHLESLITPVQDEPLFRIIKIFWVSLLNPIVMFFCCFFLFFAEELVSRAEYWRMSPTSTLHLQKNVLAAGGREGGGQKKCSLIMQWISKPNVTGIHSVNGLQTETKKQTGVPCARHSFFLLRPGFINKMFPNRPGNRRSARGWARKPNTCDPPSSVEWPVM